MGTSARALGSTTVSPPEPPEVPGVSDLHWLGSGGFADVFSGRENHLNRSVAVKVFKVALADSDAEDQFRQECQALGRLWEESNVLRVFRADLLPDSRPYLVTERCDTSLLRLIHQRGALAAGEAATYGYEIAVALLSAHSAQVLHGDVTPQNILLRRNGSAVLADFGLAVLHDYRGNTASGFNPAHAAPEVLRNTGAITFATDVYGLGSTLYTALSGAPPFDRRPGESDQARSLRILSDPPPVLDPHRVPGVFTDLIGAMLVKAPAQRPALTTVADRLAAIRDAAGPLTGRSIPAVPPAGSPAPPGPRYAPPPAAPGGGTGPQYAPPAVPQPAYAESTRSRSAGDGVAEPTPWSPRGGAGSVEPTRLRAGTVDEQSPPAGRARWLLPSAIGAVVVLAAGGAGAYFLTGGTGGPPAAQPSVAAAPARPAAPGIELDTPVDSGTSAALHWTGPAGLNYIVFVAQEGQAQPSSTITRQATDLTVDIDASAKYCFQVQGTDGRNEVVKSNVRSFRGAVCRFA